MQATTPDFRLFTLRPHAKRGPIAPSARLPASQIGALPMLPTSVLPTMSPAGGVLLELAAFRPLGIYRFRYGIPHTYAPCLEMSFWASCYYRCNLLLGFYQWRNP